MYEISACYALCEAIVNLAWRDLRNGWQDARGFLLHGWITRAMGVNAETVRARMLGRREDNSDLVDRRPGIW